MWTGLLRPGDAAKPVFGPGRITGSRRRCSANARRRAVHAHAAEGIAFAEIQVPNLASQMRVAFASMAWNTGSSSPGELD